MRDRLLVRHFLERFLDHDLISANADRRHVVAVVGGTLIAVSLFLSVLTAAKYQFANSLPPGLTSLWSLDDRFRFVTASMLVMALLAVSQWDALALDARDTGVLGILPLADAAIVRAKFVAVALLAAATATAWNLAPMLLRFAALPIELPIGVKGALILTLAQGVVTLAAGAFAFLAIFGLREALVAVLGQSRFRAISSVMQAALLVVFASALLLLPANSTNVAGKWLSREGPAGYALPPLWFVGLHETLAGSVIDDLPRIQPGRHLVVPERHASTLYRSLWPRYRQLGRVAIEALAAVTFLTIAASAWNNRHLPAPALPRRTGSLVVHRVWWATIGQSLATSSMRQAGFWFTFQTLPRRLSHRTAIAASLAVGLSLVVVTVRERIWIIEADPATVPVALLAAQSLLLASVLIGFRHATHVPSDLRASRTFSLASTGDVPSYLSGVKRAAFIVLVLPVLLVLFLWHLVVLDLRIAMLHFGTGAAFSVLLIEILFLRYRRIPFISAYEPSVELKSHGVLYVVTMLCVCFALAVVERIALADIGRYAVLVGVAVGLSATAALFDRARRDELIAFEIEEEPRLTTQPLGLAG